MVLQRGPLLLLTLSLGLARAQKTLDEVPVQPGFNAHKVEGRWFTTRLAASRAHLVSPADPLRLGLHSIWTRDEDVEFVLLWTTGGMQRSEHHHPPNRLQGQFQGSLERGAGMLVRFVSTDYSNLILYVRFEDAGETTSLWALLARRMLGDPTWLGKYLGYVARFQLQKAPVFNLDGRHGPPDTSPMPRLLRWGLACQAWNP
ncbi:hypothetical protein GH733_011087 [Mirounga leonina]|nr:hypothetical protein GH733_011087 [Mirounga leonina]